MKTILKNCKVMVFNPNKKYDFQPIMTTDTGKELDTEEEVKLLGIEITRDLKCQTNTNTSVLKFTQNSGCQEI